jgi:hypothetical protein
VHAPAFRCGVAFNPFRMSRRGCGNDRSVCVRTVAAFRTRPLLRVKVCAARQAVPAGGSCCGGLRFAPTPLWCSPWSRAANSLRSLRSLRSNRCGESVLDARCARRLQGCALGRLQAPQPSPATKPLPGLCARAKPRRHRNRPPRVPPAALPRLWSSLRTPPAASSASEKPPDPPGGTQINTSWFSVAKNRTLAARQVAPGGGDFWGDEQRRPGVGARQRASKTDSPRLFERSERSERSEFSGATPGRAAQCSRSEAETAPA